MPGASPPISYPPTLPTLALTVLAGALVPSETVTVAAPIGRPSSVTVPYTRPTAGRSWASAVAGDCPGAIVTVVDDETRPGAATVTTYVPGAGTPGTVYEPGGLA